MCVSIGLSWQDLLEAADSDAGGRIEKHEFAAMAHSADHPMFSEFIQEAGAQRRALMFSNDKAASSLPEGILINLAKAGGSVIMLKDNQGSIYKEMNNRKVHCVQDCLLVSLSCVCFRSLIITQCCTMLRRGANRQILS